MKSGHVTPLPKKILNEVISLLKDRPSPAILAEIDPEKSGNVGARIASLLSRGKISVRVVDLGPDEGFRRENARPTCEVLLVEKDGEILWEGKKRFRTEPGAFPRVFLPKAFLERNRSRPHVVYQAIVHPILEWVFGYPHMIAVLCESAYNAIPPETAGEFERPEPVHRGRGGARFRLPLLRPDPGGRVRAGGFPERGTLELLRGRRAEGGDGPCAGAGDGSPVP